MMSPPFVIFCLPRSRSAWMAKWLSRVVMAPVGHDTAIEADSVDGFLERLFRYQRGTVETGAIEAWPVIRRAIPDCRFAVVTRQIEDVAASLRQAGAHVDLDQLARHEAALESLADRPDVLWVPYDALGDPRTCARLQEHCLEQPFDWPTWSVMDDVFVRIDMAARLARLASRQPAIATLKAEVAARLANPVPFVTVGAERWADVGDAVQALGAAHHAEATAGAEGAYQPNMALLAQMAAAGLWRVLIARVDGVLAGYCCWSRDVNAESAQPRAMLHGPFYAAPQHARHRLGVRLLEASRALFAAEGFRLLKLHHTVYGRGNKARALYEDLGAVEHQREYLWRIGGD